MPKGENLKKGDALYRIIGAIIGFEVDSESFDEIAKEIDGVVEKFNEIGMAMAMTAATVKGESGKMATATSKAIKAEGQKIDLEAKRSKAEAAEALAAVRKQKLETEKARTAGVGLANELKQEKINAYKNEIRETTKALNEMGRTMNMVRQSAVGLFVVKGGQKGVSMAEDVRQTQRELRNFAGESGLKQIEKTAQAISNSTGNAFRVDKVRQLAAEVMTYDRNLKRVNQTLQFVHQAQGAFAASPEEMMNSIHRAIKQGDVGGLVEIGLVDQIEVDAQKRLHGVGVSEMLEHEREKWVMSRLKLSKEQKKLHSEWLKGEGAATQRFTNELEDLARTFGERLLPYSIVAKNTMAGLINLFRTSPLSKFAMEGVILVGALTGIALAANGVAKAMMLMRLVLFGSGFLSFFKKLRALGYVGLLIGLAVAIEDVWMAMEGRKNTAFPKLYRFVNGLLEAFRDIKTTTAEWLQLLSEASDKYHIWGEDKDDPEAKEKRKKLTRGYWDQDEKRVKYFKPSYETWAEQIVALLKGAGNMSVSNIEKDGFWNTVKGSLDKAVASPVMINVGGTTIELPYGTSDEQAASVAANIIRQELANQLSRAKDRAQAGGQ